MTGDTLPDERTLALLDRYYENTVENAIRVGKVFDTDPIVEKIVSIVRTQGEEGILAMRHLLGDSAPGDVKADCAAEVLAELRDAASLPSLLRRTDIILQSGEQAGKFYAGSLEKYYKLARKMTEGVDQVDDNLVEHLLMLIQRVNDSRNYGGVMETAASFPDERIKQALLRLATANVSEDWEKNTEAVLALRHFPDQQDTLISLLCHPQSKVAQAAGKALVNILDLIPGNKAENYEQWRAWAEPRVPPPLQPLKPTGLSGLFSRKPRLDPTQQVFWKVCWSEHSIYYRDHPSWRR